MTYLLAFDASTTNFSAALGRITNAAPLEILAAKTVAAAKSSDLALPIVLDLMRQSDIGAEQLKYIVFAQGPGSFTGVRLNCCLAQGLAFGLKAKVIALNTLWILAQQAYFYFVAPNKKKSTSPLVIEAALDARMQQIYCARFNYWPQQDKWLTEPIKLIAPKDFMPAPASFLVGNIFTEYAAELNFDSSKALTTTPNAGAMLQLAEYYLKHFSPLAPQQALPLYIRNKVALTVAERNLLAAQKNNHGNNL